MAYSVSDVLSCVGGGIANEGSDGCIIDISKVKVSEPSPLESSGPTHVSFYFSKVYSKELPLSKAGILVTCEEFLPAIKETWAWKYGVVISCADPYLAMAKVSALFAELSSVAHLESASPDNLLSAPSKMKLLEPVIHPTAVVDSSAELGAGVTIGENCVVRENVKIGRGTRLYPGCIIGPGNAIGEWCVLFPNVVIYEKTILGNFCRIHAGVVLGADGFGYSPVFTEHEGRKIPVTHRKIHHVGGVRISNNVEIGANTCIDRGTWGDTVIEKNVKIDNMVMIGHNCYIKEGSILCGMVGVAGSTKIGKFVVIGGAAAVGNNAVLGDYCKIGACSCISKSVAAGTVAVGNPMRDPKQFFKAHALLNKMVAEKTRKRARTQGKDSQKEMLR
jgi:UDP-3-O-[3-hydroxymyristoyl] glucosamine N-acyltransferase